MSYQETAVEIECDIEKLNKARPKLKKIILSNKIQYFGKIL